MRLPRRHSIPVRIGSVTVGGTAPIVVQSMTNTDTADIEGTVQQIRSLARAGSELVRVTVNADEAAAAVPHIRERLDRAGVPVPIVGDFHFNGHRLLKAHPACAEALLQPSTLEAFEEELVERLRTEPSSASREVSDNLRRWVSVGEGADLRQVVTRLMDSHLD